MMCSLMRQTLPGLIKNEGVAICPYRQRKVLQPVKPAKAVLTYVGKNKGLSAWGQD